MYAGQKSHLLETKAFVDAGNVQIQVRGIERGRRVRGFLCVLDAVVKQGAAAVAITGSTLKRLFKTVRLGDRVNTTGQHLRTVAWHMHGVEAFPIADVPATNGASFRRVITAYIPFGDERALAGMDPAPAPEFYSETPLTIDFDSSLALFPNLDTTTPVTGSLRVYVVHEPLDFGVVPSVQEIGWVDPGAQHIELGGERVYTHLHLFRESGAVITSDDVTGLSISADGQILTNLPLRVQDLARMFNWLKATGSSWGSPSATAPVGGEQLTDDPAYTAAAATTVSLEFVPVITVPHAYRLTKALHVQSLLTIDLTGAMANGFRLGYRAIIPRTDDMQERARVILGIPPGTPVPKTFSKTANPSPRYARILPARYPVA